MKKILMCLSLAPYENNHPMFGDHLFKGVETASAVFDFSTIELSDGSAQVAATYTPVSDSNGKTFPQESTGADEMSSAYQVQLLPIDTDIYTGSSCHAELSQCEISAVTFAKQQIRNGNDPLILIEPHMCKLRNILKHEGINSIYLSESGYCNSFSHSLRLTFPKA